MRYSFLQEKYVKDTLCGCVRRNTGQSLIRFVRDKVLIRIKFRDTHKDNDWGCPIVNKFVNMVLKLRLYSLIILQDTLWFAG